MRQALSATGEGRGLLAYAGSRRFVQAGFLALTLIGVYVVQGNAERWCPFGGVEALFTYVGEGNVLCSLAVTNFFILGGVLVTTLLLRRAFCGYVCPIGTISEWTRDVGARLGLPAARVGERADAVASLLKYGVLALILVLTWRAEELIFRGFDPCYALIGRHGEDITLWTYVVAGAVLLASLMVSLPFCRWLCPLAAVLNPFSRVGLGRVVRDTGTCQECGKCAQVCPMQIPVHRLEEVSAARCTSCLECVESCPTRGRRTLAWRLPGGSRRAFPRGALIAILLVVLATSVAGAWLAPLPSFTWTRGDPPLRTEEVEFLVHDLTCRGRANLFVYYLERDDDLRLKGYLRLEAWPGPGAARARITFDPSATNATTIREAILEPYYDNDRGFWRMSPFRIE
ncbi:MAG: 4Fe-4S binding protein [Planctomycetota bacterium]